MTRSQVTALLFFGLFTTTVFAAGMDIKPGLWEIQHKMTVDGQKMPDMQEMMAQVPPEMREQMKAMMAQQGAGMTDKGTTVCVTAEQIARGEVGTQDKESRCKISNLKMDGTTTTMDIKCDAPRKAEGTTTVTRTSNTQWTSTTNMKTDKGEMKQEATGKWLKADCGAVKPR